MDLPAIVRMGVAFLGSTDYGRLFPGTTPEGLGLYATQIMERGLVLLAEVDGAPVGMLLAGVYPHPMNHELTGCEFAWWIDPRSRGGGLATRLLAQAEGWARQRGALSFQMLEPEGSGLGELYARRGYAPVERIWQRSLLEHGEH